MTTLQQTPGRVQRPSVPMYDTHAHSFCFTGLLSSKCSTLDCSAK